MPPTSPRKGVDMQRPRPFASSSDFGFLGAQAGASGSGLAGAANNNPSSTSSAQHSQDPPSPRKLKHGRTTSVPNLHKLSTGSERPSSSLSHSRSRSWLATLLKPGPSSPVPPLPTQVKSPPASPGKGASSKGRRGTLGGTLRRRVEDGLGLPFAASERGRLEFGCVGRDSIDGERVEELAEVVEAPRRPQRPREELDQDLISIRLRERSSHSPSRHSTYTPTSPRLRLSHYGTQPLPPPPPYSSLHQSFAPAPADPARPSPRSHPSLTALRANQPQSRLRPRSAHRTEAVELTREWREVLQAIPDASFDGSGAALASLLNELGGEGGGGLSRSKRREAPVSPTSFAGNELEDAQHSDPSGQAKHAVFHRVREQAGLTHSASLVSLSAFPSPPLAGAAGFIHPPSSSKSLAARRAQLVAPLILRPASAFDDDSPLPSAASLAAGTPEEERGRIVFSPYRTDSIIDHGNRYSIVVERERDVDEDSVESEHECDAVEGAEAKLCAAGRLGVNMIMGSHFSPITNSSNSSFEGSQDGSHVSALAGHSPTTTHNPVNGVCGLEIDGLSLKQLGMDRPSSLVPPAHLHHPARHLHHLHRDADADLDAQHLDLPPSSTFTSASFSPFSGSVASFSTNPSSLDGDRERDALAIPDNVKWRWERSGVFPSSAGSSAAGSRSVSGASSLMPGSASVLGKSAAGRSVSGLSVLEYYAEAGVGSPDASFGRGEWEQGDSSVELDASQARWEEEMLRAHEVRMEKGGATGVVRQRSEGEDGEVAWGVAL